MHLRYPEGIQSIVDAISPRGNVKAPVIGGTVNAEPLLTRRLTLPAASSISSRERPLVRAAWVRRRGAGPIRFDPRDQGAIGTRMDTNLLQLSASADLTLQDHDKPILLGAPKRSRARPRYVHASASVDGHPSRPRPADA
jgi:hypothetical protein